MFVGKDLVWLMLLFVVKFGNGGICIEVFVFLVCSYEYFILGGRGGWVIFEKLDWGVWCVF